MTRRGYVHDRPGQIDRDLRSLLGDAEELAEIFAEPGGFDALSEAEEDAWAYEWGNEMAKAEALARMRESGEMTPEQERLHDEIKARLRELAPALNEAGLRVPPDILDG